MNILVTGATGYIGSAVAEALVEAGHHVHGLAHDRTAWSVIVEQGWVAVGGDLRDAAALEDIASRYDAAVHAANTGAADAGEVDTAAVRAMLRGLAPHNGTLVYTSGAWVLGAGRTDEGSVARPASLVAWRAGLEQEVLNAQAVRGVVVRPGIAYGRGAGIPGMLARGELPLIASGTQRWPLVHVADLAQLYVRALDAPHGSLLHAVTTTMSMRDLARLAELATGSVAERVSLDAARERFGAFADALALDQDMAADATRALLSWTPSAPGVVEEFVAGSYTRVASVAA